MKKVVYLQHLTSALSVTQERVIVLDEKNDVRHLHIRSTCILFTSLVGETLRIAWTRGSAHRNDSRTPRLCVDSQKYIQDKPSLFMPLGHPLIGIISCDEGRSEDPLPSVVLRDELIRDNFSNQVNQSP